MKRSIALLPTGNQMTNWSLKGTQLKDMTGLNLLSYGHAQDRAGRTTKSGVLTLKQPP